MKSRIVLSLIVFVLCLKATAQVTVTSSDSINCTNPRTTLTASVIGETPTDAGVSVDDIYSSVRSIGFNFNFYGTNYNRLLIGPNGTLCFDTTLAGSFVSWVIDAPLLGEPLVYNSICGPWCDIDITEGGSITYSVIGAAPFRKFTVTFCSTHMFSCTSQVTSTQFILYETTNIAEVHIARKDVCSTWNGGFAIIGVQNATGTAATAAPGRDWPSVFTCTNEAWRFTPVGGGASYTVASIPYAPVPYSSSLVYWYNATTGAFLGTGTTLTVSPTTTTTYMAGAIGCSDTSFGYYTVVPQGNISPTFVRTNPTVCQGCDGTITIGGLAPGLTDTVMYNYNGVPQTPVVAVVSASGTITLTGLCAGTYDNIVVYQVPCSSSPAGPIVLTNPPITITVTRTTDPTICGYANGTITLSGYVPSTSYTINYLYNSVPSAPVTLTSSAAGTITLTGLLAGTYSNIVSTGGPCPPTVAGPTTLVDPPPPTVTVDSAVVNTCVGVPVLLHAYPSLTGIPYSYTWTPPTYLSSSTIANPVVTPGAAGDFVYTITINPGTNPACNSSTTVTVHTLAPFVLHNPDTFVCIGQSVQTRVTGSNEFIYRWTPPTGVSNVNIKTPIITAPSTQTYTLTASYAACPDMVQDFNIQIDNPAPVFNIRDTICLGMSTTVDLTVAGGAYYHYQWTPATGVSNDTLPNPVITPTSIGTSTYIVNLAPRALGCDRNSTVIIEVLPNTINIRPTDTAVCRGQYVQVIGTGHPVFTYQWLPTAGIAISDVLNARITPDTTDNYVVTASFHRCPDMYAYLNLDVQPNPTVYIGGNRFMCEFDTLHVNSFVSPSWYGSYIYSWTPATDLDFSNTANVVFSGGTTTELLLDVSTPAGCRSNDSAVITVIPGNFAALIEDAEFCPGDTLQLVPVTTVAGVSYHWNPPYYLSDSAGSAPVIKPITTQTYTVVATTPNGCKDTMNFNAVVHPAGVMNMDDSARIYPGEQYRIQPMTNCVSVSWFPPAGLDNANITDPTATPIVSTRYIATGYTDHNCVVRDSIDVFVNEESEVAVPNAFTPGTGNNNTYKVMVKGIAQLVHFRIFDRWGNVVFQTNNINEGWDGTFNGKPQSFGVYVYEFEAVTTSGKRISKHGNVTLLR